MPEGHATAIAMYRQRMNVFIWLIIARTAHLYACFYSGRKRIIIAMSPAQEDASYQLQRLLLRTKGAYRRSDGTILRQAVGNPFFMPTFALKSEDMW